MKIQRGFEAGSVDVGRPVEPGSLLLRDCGWPIGGLDRFAGFAGLEVEDVATRRYRSIEVAWLACAATVEGRSIGTIESATPTGAGEAGHGEPT